MKIGFTGTMSVGNALSARGITVSGAQGTYVAESILKVRKLDILDEVISNE